MSARFNSAENAVPMTNPSCTMAVSQPNEEGERCHRAASGDETALAANHSEIPRSYTHPKRTSIRHRRGSLSSTMDPAALGAASIGIENDIVAILMRSGRARDHWMTPEHW